TELPTDWENLQRPGYSPDYLEDRYERMDLAYRTEDWIPTLAAEAMYRNNMALLAYIAGPESAVTSRAHVFNPGESVHKQLVIINNCRQKVTCDWRWKLSGPHSDGSANNALAGSEFHLEQAGQVGIETGQQCRQPVEISLPPTLPPGRYLLSADFLFSTGERQRDVFPLEVIPSAEKQTVANEIKAQGAKIGVFDPVGETIDLLKQLGIAFRTIGAADDPSELDLLIIGKKALTVDGPAPSIEAVRSGLKVLVFEQTGEVMEKRLGFRIAEYGLRQVFPRVPDHPVLEGLSEEHFHDWRGSATLLPPRLEYLSSDRYAGAPTVRWCGLEVTRLWRCGNRGNVASVLLEKPQRGDFLPILDGGFALQYTPLVEYREGKGCVLFCQLDVTGRTERDPVAEQIVANMIRYLTARDRSLPPERRAVYVGDMPGRMYLTRLGIPLEDAPDQKLTAEHVLIVGPGAGGQLEGKREEIANWLAAGGHILVLGMEGKEVNSFLPATVRTESREYINAFFSEPSFSCVFAGIAPADVHNRDPRNLPVLADGVERLCEVLGQTNNDQIVFCQLLPFDFVKKPDAVPGLRIVTDDYREGRACAEITMATVPWAQFGQKTAGGQVGKTYTLSAWVKPLEEPVTVRLEVEQAGPPWDRLARGKDVTLPPDQWSEVRLSFTVNKAYPEGWQAYLHVGQPEARLRVDTMELIEETENPSVGSGTSKNLLANGDFEEGTNPWYFNWTTEQQNLRKTFRRTAVTLSRLLANMGLRPTTPLLKWFSQPIQQGAQKSLVNNGTFSEDKNHDEMPDGWTFSCEVPQALCTTQREERVPGSTAVCIEVPSGSGERRTTAMLAQHGVPIEEGQWYRVSFWARAENLSGRQAWIAVQETTKWRALLEYQRFVPGREWKRYTYLLVGQGTELKNTRLQIWFEGSGKLYLADVAIVPCDLPTEGRWLHGLYLDRPQEWDDPYRFFRW
ncbi:carbohydrate binding domain-containing protein, partial [Thermogutta sp.]|uniref:carbohydrate binding domain-containing protein n=1 Tax=Thermogutta sp. TaxID=1962930 RepID=UPI0032207ECE